MKLNKNLVAFTGGGTGGHIYPGLAVADELKKYCEINNHKIEIEWIGCSKGMDKKIVESALDRKSNRTADYFYGIPSGKLRRYLSFQNFLDLFKIFAGFISAFLILKKTKPCVLFSKGGFVSVPPCFAAKLLKIPVYTHECDFTLGLANRINFKSAKNMFVSYEETRNRLPLSDQKRVIVTGNPVRPVFYEAHKENGLKFLGLEEKSCKPVLLVLGGSSGAKQINNIVFENLEWLCEHFIVVHQTGLINNNEVKEAELKARFGKSYLPYQFIYSEMPDVVAASDLILSRAGANSIWEGAVLAKPMVLIPLCGSGTRGDQVDNAKFFEEKKCAVCLAGENVTADNLKEKLMMLKNDELLKQYSDNLKTLCGNHKPAETIAKIIYSESL